MTGDGNPVVGIATLVSGGNGLLAEADEEDLAFIAEHARRRRFALGDVLLRADEAAEVAYFVETGVASVIRPEAGGRRTEIRMAGSESLLGMAIVLADGRCLYESVAQSDELRAICLGAERLLELTDRSPRFRRLVLRAAHVEAVQTAENLASAAWLQVYERLARWLLMYRDRLGSDRIEVTHEFMAVMIGAQRTRVTVALHELERMEAIRAERGLVIIRDAAQLKRIAGNSYGLTEREAERLAGSPGLSVSTCS